MKKAREKWLIKGRKENEEREYHQKRKAHKIIRNKKKLYIKNVIESVEDQKHYNTRKMYQTINQFKKGYKQKLNMIRNKNGELALNTKESRSMERIF